MYCLGKLKLFCKGTFTKNLFFYQPTKKIGWKMQGADCVVRVKNAYTENESILDHASVKNAGTLPAIIKLYFCGR